MAADNLRKFAPVAFELWRRGGEWVDRRVVTVDLLDVETVRIWLSVDFRIPMKLPGGIRMGGWETYFLPLTVLPRRSNMAYFDVRAEDGASVPLLTRQENARITGSMLTIAAQGALDAAPDRDLELSSGLRAYLATIPTMTQREGRVLVRSVLNPDDGIVYPQKRVARVILANEDFRDLLGLSASCSFIHVPVVATPGERRIIKIGLITHWDSRSAKRSGVADTLRRQLGHGTTWLGWRADARYLFMPQVGNAKSFHIQVSTPERVEFTEAGMRNKPLAELVQTDASRAPVLAQPATEEPNDAVGYDQFVGGISQHKHLYISNASAHRAGIVWVRFRLVRRGFLRAALAVAWLVSILLGLYALRADNIVGDSQTAAALLLIVPALIAGFLIAPGEHDITRHLQRGPRVLTAGIGLVALLATAAMLTIPSSRHSAPDSLVCIWTVEAVIAAALSLLLTASLVLPRAGRRHKSPPLVEHHTLAQSPPQEQGPDAGG
jgi:hypothetical protein